jgi:hypothetical protein
LVDISLPLDLLPADAVRFIPVQFRLPHSACPQPDDGGSANAIESPSTRRRRRIEFNTAICRGCARQSLNSFGGSLLPSAKVISLFDHFVSAHQQLLPDLMPGV